MAVAVPPMLEKSTSAISTCFGSRSSTSHNLQINGKKGIFVIIYYMSFNTLFMNKEIQSCGCVK